MEYALLVLIAISALALTVGGLRLAYKLQNSFNQANQTPLIRFTGPQALNLAVSVLGVLILLYAWQAGVSSQQSSVELKGIVQPGSFSADHPVKAYAAVAQELVSPQSGGFEMSIPDPRQPQYEILLIQEDRVVGAEVAKGDPRQPLLVNFPAAKKSPAPQETAPQAPASSGPAPPTK